MPLPSFSNQVWDPGTENLGGLLGKVVALPLFAADIAGLTCTDGKTLVGNLALVDTQKAFTIDVSEDSIVLNHAQSGDANAEKTTQTLQFFVPGPPTAFNRTAGVTPMIWFVKDAKLKYQVVGLSALQTEVGTYVVNKDIEARVTATEGTFGQRADARKGTLFTITYVTSHGPLEYGGTIPFTAV